MDLEKIEKKLKRPFEYSDIEWRTNRVFKSGKATVLAYITSRGVMNRLDEVFGIAGWQDNYEFLDKNVVCTLEVKFPNSIEWIYKTDGAPQTTFESFKGGISDALKRCAVKLGIGRYLYNLTESWVDIKPDKPKGVNKKHIHYVNDKSKGIEGYWISPELPEWALPENSTKSEEIIEQILKGVEIFDKKAKEILRNNGIKNSNELKKVNLLTLHKVNSLILELENEEV